ncbi:replication protein [Staphylococcus ureilyticus]|nr:replication protein [Staphylococcus ureilyticus]QKU19760.1 protein rep [Staphylococcus cohnii]
MCLNTISLTNNSNELTAIKENSKYSIKSSDFLTDDDEKNQEIVNDLEKVLYRKRMLSYGGLLKQKHKILNLDDVEDGNLINISDEDKTTDEEEKAHSITAIWNFEKQNYYLKKWLTSFTMQILICM